VTVCPHVRFSCVMSSAASAASCSLLSSIWARLMSTLNCSISPFLEETEETGERGVVSDECDRYVLSICFNGILSCGVEELSLAKC
jgi:hypothetical protein